MPHAEDTFSFTRAPAMLDLHPTDLAGVDHGLLAACIEACLACAQACTACADLCLDEEDVAELRACIRLLQDCADVCATTARVLSRRTGGNGDVSRVVVEACAWVCSKSGGMCAWHAVMGNKQCRICAEECRRCEAVCRAFLASLRGHPVP